MNTAITAGSHDSEEVREGTGLHALTPLFRERRAEVTVTTTAPPPLLPLAGPRTRDAVTVCFAISPRSDHDDIPERDARRVSEMRRLARASLEICGLSALADDMSLLVTELVTNGIKHSRGTEITVTLRFDGGELRLDVSDETNRHPQIQQPDDDAENGRGLQLVHAITQQHGGSWGISPDGTSTWCTIPAAAAGRSE